MNDIIGGIVALCGHRHKEQRHACESEEADTRELSVLYSLPSLCPVPAAQEQPRRFEGRSGPVLPHNAHQAPRRFPQERQAIIKEDSMKRLFLLVLGLALAVAPVDAQDAAKPKAVDITGSWEMTVETPQGTMVITANFKQDGEMLTGTHISEMGEAPLKGTVKGADVEYTLTLDMGGQQMSIVHKAKVDGDTMRGSADIEGMGTIAFTAKRKP
jgi:hypothetical protein